MSEDDLGEVIVDLRRGGPSRPASADEAIARLNRGNAAFAGLGEGPDTSRLSATPSQIGLAPGPGETLPQEPYAAALGCSDARVPLEFVFGAGVNDIFATRVAGNVATPIVVGSFSYAMAHLPTVQVAAVLGHSSCGAVTAAVRALLLAPGGYAALADDTELRGIIEALRPAVVVGALALEEVHGDRAQELPGHRAALVQMVAVANAALNAQTLAAKLSKPVVFGVYDLPSRTVGAPTGDGWRVGLHPAPVGAAELEEVLLSAARQTDLGG